MVILGVAGENAPEDVEGVEGGEDFKFSLRS
jgi:hypothetical protein